MRSWALVSLLVLVLCAALATTRPAAASDCGPPPRQAQVDVASDIRPATLDLSLGIVALTAYGGDAAMSGSNTRQYTLGSTEIEVSRQVQFEMTGWEHADGGKCWSITRANLELVMETVVHVAAEIPPNSCAWNEVIAHEKLHIDIDRQLFPQLVSEMRAGAMLVAGEAIPAETDVAATTAAKERLSATLGEIARRHSEVRNARQLAIDTPEEYGRFAAACGQAEMSNILAKAGIR